MVLMNSMDMKEFTDNGLMEIAGLTSRREYNLSLVKSRQLAEHLVKSYAEEKNIEYTTLADTIESLFQNGVIDRTSRDAFHNIRMYGNKAVHEGDNDAEDAQKSYYLLKNEVQTFMSRKAVSVDRTPVRVDRNQVSNRRPAFSEDGNAILGRSVNGKEVDAADQQRQRRQRGSSGRSTRGESGSRGSEGQRVRRQQSSGNEGGGVNIYDLLRILIPVLAAILLIIIIRSLLPSKKKPAETTTPAAVETTAEVPSEEAAESEEAPTEAVTEAPKSFEYKIKGNGVNIRYADNQDRIYTQLSNGTAIGTVEEIEGSDFVKFTLDGVSVVVRKDFIEPIE